MEIQTYESMFKYVLKSRKDFSSMHETAFFHYFMTKAFGFEIILQFPVIFFFVSSMGMGYMMQYAEVTRTANNVPYFW